MALLPVPSLFKGSRKSEEQFAAFSIINTDDTYPQASQGLSLVASQTRD